MRLKLPGFYSRARRFFFGIPVRIVGRGPTASKAMKIGRRRGLLL
jgi:hypothetical protein